MGFETENNVEEIVEEVVDEFRFNPFELDESVLDESLLLGRFGFFFYLKEQSVEDEVFRVVVEVKASHFIVLCFEELGRLQSGE